MPGATIGKNLNPMPRIFWKGQITIQDRGSGIDFQIDRESDADPQVGELIRLQLEKLVFSLTFNCRECLNGHEHNPNRQAVQR